jgi:phage gp29-like protein
MAETTDTPGKPNTDEVASALDGRDITRFWLNPLTLQPPDDNVLMTRGTGDYTLYREVLRDDHVKAALQQRVNAVTSRPWEVRPGGEKRIDKQAALYLEEQLEALRWDAITEKMLAGVFYGYAVAEVLWKTDGVRIGIDEIKVRDRRRFAFDGADRLRLKTRAMPQGELLPERKFWHFSTGADHDDAPYGLGLAHWLYWPVWLKRNGVKFWANFLEKFASPTAMGTFPPGTSPTDQANLLAALSAIQTDSAIIFPDGMNASLLEATRGGTADYATFAAAMNAAILVITIGQTASTQGTPGKLGNDQNQSEVRADISKADADLVCMSFNATVARWLTEWNFPGAALPQVWRIMEEEDDLNTRAERDVKLTSIGYKPSLKYIQDTYGGEWEAAAPAPATPSTLPAAGVAVVAKGTAEFADPIPEPDTPDTQAARLAADTANAMTDLIAEVGKMVAAAASIEDLQRDLVNAYGNLDTEELTRIMALAFAAAELAGMVEAGSNA